MFSVYTSLYHIEKHSFPWRESLENFIKFVGEDGEVVIAVNKSEDNTLDIIKKFAAENPIVKIVETDYLYTNIEMDGLIKNAALQATTKSLKIQMDADEIFILSQRDKWIEYGNWLLKSKVEVLMIPTLDLYGSKDKIRANSQIGLKFRMHKGGLKRGVWKEARRGDRIDTSKSDTCEILTPNGDLPFCQGIVSPTLLNPLFSSQLKDYIYTAHLGYLSFEHRVNINNKLWNDHWKLRSGGHENVATSIDQLKNELVIAHNLPVE
jgi:glycosyltransferase involved in cell wall biosynthesis